MNRAIIFGIVALALGTAVTVIIVKVVTNVRAIEKPSASTKSRDVEEVEDFEAENISAYTALYDEGVDAMRLMLDRMSKSCSDSGSGMRGIYIDFIYNPKYYFELTVLRHMLLEILNGNPHMRYYYDNVHYPNSTIITVGYEHVASRFSERSVITIKPKLLKDILYTANIFDQLYNFLLSYFRSCIIDPTLVPEYDRTINFKRYRSIFADTLAAMDDHNQATTICRNDELYGAPNHGRVCVVARVNVTDFRDADTSMYWQQLLARVSAFMGVLLETTFVMRSTGQAENSNRPCYRIELRPEIDIRRVLLFPHAAVKTAMSSESLKFGPETRDRIADDIILFKHRVLHALGVGHRYSRRAIMNSYDNDWQRHNLFGILPEDYAAMAQCYGDDVNLADFGLRRSPNVPTPSHGPNSIAARRTLKKYVTDMRDNEMSDRMLDLFISDFDRFMFELRSR